MGSDVASLRNGAVGDLDGLSGQTARRPPRVKFLMQFDRMVGVGICLRR
ncbi:MAG: hypothetical protein ACU0DM_02025 [Paracoccus sp. (in: a-proteobacteria)]